MAIVDKDLLLKLFHQKSFNFHKIQLRLHNFSNFLQMLKALKKLSNFSTLKQ
jgi:hypothetical protein